MIKQTMQLSREKIEQRRQDRKAVKRNNRQRTIKKSCCNECGQRKHYICLDHHQFPNKGLKKIIKQIRYRVRKFYFGLSEKFKFAE